MFSLACLVTFIACVFTALVVFGNMMRAGPGKFQGRSVIIVVWVFTAAIWLAWLSN